MQAVITGQKATCTYCRKPIPRGTRSFRDVNVRYYGAAKYYRSTRFHPGCFWIQSVEQWKVADPPKSGHSGGRKPLDITDSQKKQRRKLLSRLNHIRWKSRNGFDTDSLSTEIFQITSELKEVGGIPKGVEQFGYIQPNRRRT